MKICFMINSLENSGGTERVTTLLANMLTKVGFEVYIITQQGGTKSFFDLDPAIQRYYLFEESGINIYSKYLISLSRYRKLLSRISPDYIIDVCVAMSLLSLPASAGKATKVISWEHFNSQTYFNYLSAIISKWAASKFCRHVVTLTDKDCEMYNEKFNAKSVICIPNPVTIDVKQPPDYQSKHVLAIGRLTHQKGFDMLLNAWKIVSAGQPEWKLSIVGNGELRDELIQQSLELAIVNSVHFIPASTEIYKHYSSASIFVMSSRFEGLPLVLIEAKAYGLPIVSFDCETGPAEIINDQRDGILVKSGDIQLLANSLLMLMSDPERRKEMGKAAVEDSKRYAPEQFLDKWLRILL